MYEKMQTHVTTFRITIIATLDKFKGFSDVLFKDELEQVHILCSAILLGLQGDGNGDIIQSLQCKKPCHCQFSHTRRNLEQTSTAKTICYRFISYDCL